MLSRVIKYSSINAKVQALEGKLLSESDFKTMASLSSVKDVVHYLKDTKGYKDVLKTLDEDDIHRGRLEPFIANSIYGDFSKIYRFLDSKQKAFFNAYFLRYEIRELKNILHLIVDDRDRIFDLNSIPSNTFRHFNVDLEALSKSATLSEFIEGMRKSPYFKVLPEEIDEKAGLFDIEMRLDMFFFRNLWSAIEKTLTKKEQEVLHQSIGAYVDMLNLQWIYRAKKYYNVDNNIIISYLIPIRGRLCMQQLSRITAEDAKDMLSSFEDTPYKGLLSSKTMAQILHEIDAHLKRANPFSIAVIISYLSSKELEVKKITTLIEAIRYGVDNISEIILPKGEL